MGQEQSATRVMRLVVDDRLAANSYTPFLFPSPSPVAAHKFHPRSALPAPQRDSIGGMSGTSASVHRANSSWSVLLNGSHVLALDGSVSFAGYSDLRGIIVRAAEALSPSTSLAIQQLASGCFLFLQSHHLLDQKPISVLSEKSSNVYMTAVSTSRNSRRIHLTNPEAIWTFTCKLSESTTSPPCFQVPLLLSDLFSDVIQHLSKKLAETVDFECAPMNFRPTSVGQCIESMDLHSSSADFEINVNAKENTINLVCLTCTTQNASSLSSTNQVATLSDERRFMELEAIATAASIDAAMQRFENMQSYASSGADMLEKFNFDAIANSLRFISNVGEMIPFISCACKVLSMMTAYIDSLEETKNDMVQLKKHCRLLEEAINLKVKVFFEEDSRWIVDDETCLTCYKVSLNEAVDALSSAIKRVETYSKEGLISKSMNRSKMDLKAEERKLDFALKSLTILDPFQLAFDMSQIEHFFQSADAKRFWKSARFRDNVTTTKFMKELQRHCLKTTLSMQDEMPIIQAVDVNMDGYVHVEEFARVFNADTVGETVSLLLESKKTYDLGELRELCNPTDYAADAVDLLRDYISGTRDTLVNALDKEIQEVKSHSVFILHATAGFGKSVIVAKLASLSNNSRQAPAVGVANSFAIAAEGSSLMYLLYFFRHDDREIRTFDQFLKTLVYQLCCQLRSKEFQDKVEAILKQGQDEPVSNDAENEKTLLEVVVGKLSSMDNVVILIDACDECAVDSWQYLADFIKKLTSKKEPGTLAHVARIVMTIRNDETSKQSKFKDFDHLIKENAFEVGKTGKLYSTHETNLEGILANNEERDDFLSKARNRMAVQIYFESNIPHLSQRGCQILVEKSKGNMLWARLALNVIRDARLDADVTYIAHNLLKPDMGSLYLEFFKSGVKMRTNDPEDMKRLLSIIACAVRPLLLKDVREVWRFTASGISDKSDEQFAQVLVYPLCRMMVRTNAQGFVFLGHKSLRDMVDSSLLSQFVDTSVGHESLALFCIDTITNGSGSGTLDYIQRYASEHLLLHFISSGCKESVITALDSASVAAAMSTLGSNTVADGLLFVGLKGAFSFNDVALSVRNMLRVQDGEDSLPYKELDVVGASAMSQAALKFPSKTLRVLAHMRVSLMADSSDFNCAKGCFVILGELKYNMANIASPYERYDRAWNAGPRLAYASCQWCRHFSAVSDATALLSDLALFCQENLLYWIETMLLLFWKSVDKIVVITERIAVILKNLERYANTDSTAAMSTVLLSDALNMLRFFQEPLYFNPLQLYHSALLWCPQESALYKVYYKQYREKHNIPLLSILDGKELMKHWKLDHKLDKPDERRFRKTSEWKMTSITISSKFILVGYEAVSLANSRVQLWRTGVEDTFKCFQWGRHVTAIAISPDDRWIVAGTADGSVVLQFLQEDKYLVLGDSRSYKPNVKFDGIRSVSISCDEWGNPKLIAAASGNNKVTLWDYTSNFKTRYVLDGPKNDDQNGPYAGKIQSVQSLAFSKNGKFLVAGSENGTVIVWTPDGKCIQKMETIQTPVNHFLAKPNIVPAKSITIQPEYGRSYKFESTCFPISAIAISHDGTKIAAGGTAAGTVNLWERSGPRFNMVSSKVWHSSRVEKLEFTADSKFLLSAVKDETLQVWNLRSMQSVIQLGLAGTIKTFALFPDEKSVAIVTDANVRILSLPDLMAFPDHDERVQEESIQHKKSGICENLVAAPMPPAAVDRVDSGIEVPGFQPSTPPVAVAALKDPKPPEFAKPQEWIDDADDPGEKERRKKAVMEYRRANKNQQNQESVLTAKTIFPQKSDNEGGAAMSVIQSVTSTMNGVICDSDHPPPRQTRPQVSTEATESKEIEEIEVRMPNWYLTKNGEHVVAAGNGSLQFWDLKDEPHFRSEQLKNDRLTFSHMHAIPITDDQLRSDKIAESENGRFVVCACARDLQNQRSDRADRADTSKDTNQDESNCLLVLFSTESNSDVAHAEFPKVCDSVEISGDGSVVGIISDGNVYLWAWADENEPVHLAQLSKIVKMGVSESLVACATADGAIQLLSHDKKTGAQDGIECLQTVKTDKEEITSIWITGSSQVSISRKFRGPQVLQNEREVEHWERKLDTWTLSSKSPVLSLMYEESGNDALSLFSAKKQDQALGGWVLHGTTALCWVPSDTATAPIVANNTILFYPAYRMLTLKFHFD